MRGFITVQIVAAAATALSPVAAAAAPVRAAAALPAGTPLGVKPPARAATAVREPAQLIGFPILAFVALFGTVSVVAIVASGRGRSPG